MKGFKMPKASSCHCCPYGFHIDRDFVRYCESLYNIAQLDKLKLKKRERRKEQMTVESCLGLSMRSIPNDGGRPLVDNTSRPSSGNAFLCDLDGVMSDFEDTWQKSINKKVANSTPNEIDNFTDASSQSFVQLSKCSLEQGSPVFESASNIPEIDALYGSDSSNNNTVGIHRDVLTNIRSQMATSLKRMKELEDQVKSIPALQVKLSVLNEERNLLLNQLKTKHGDSAIDLNESVSKRQIQGMRNQGLMVRLANRDFSSGSLTSSTEDLTSPAMAHNLNDVLAKRVFVDSEIISQIHLDENSLYSNNLLTKLIKDVKHVGTWCSVLTRDIGVGHIQNKCKSTGVGDESIQDVPHCFRCFQEKGAKQSISISSESLESDSDSAYNDQIFFTHQKTMNRFPRKSVKSVATSPMSIKDIGFATHKSSSDAFTETETDVRQAGTSTDLHMCDVMSSIELEKRKKLRKNKSTSCDYPVKSSKGVQVPVINLIKCDKTSASVQTSCSYLPVFDIKQNTQKRNIGTGDWNVNDVMCQKCSHKRYKSVSVGDSMVSDILCDKCCCKQMVSIGCGFQSIFDVNCNRCELRQTETIGVGDDDVNQPVSMLYTNIEDDIKIQELKEKPVMMRSVGTNTSSDTALGIGNNSINICDKCSAAIHSVAQDVAARKNEASRSHATIKTELSRPVSKSKSSLHHSKSTVQKLQISTKTASHVHPTSKLNDKKPLSLSNAPKMSGSEELEKKSELNSEETTEDVFGKQSSEVAVNPFKVVQPERLELTKEVKAACKVLCDCLQKPNHGSEKKMLSSLNIVKNEWFQVANQKNADPHVIEGYLDAFEEISRPLLQRIVNLSDGNGNTALHYAVSYSNFDVVSILVDSKVCDVNKQNKAGYTCIMLVALADTKNDAHSYVVQRLFNMGDINIKATQNGQTALMLAVSHGKLDIVKMLLEAGSEVNLQDNDGSTALMCAAEHGHIEIVRTLLSHPDCDPAILDSDGCNALTIAMEAGHKDIGLLIYANMNFSRGSSPYSSLKQKRRTSSRSTPPPRTPTVRTPSSPSARSTSSLPSAFHFLN